MRTSTSILTTKRAWLSSMRRTRTIDAASCFHCVPIRFKGIFFDLVSAGIRDAKV